jgi:MerR family mercuric resistance operon transcriptional regulator
MRIGELARLSGLNIQTLRFYERRGLMLAPPRNLSGYRYFEKHDLERVQFIRTCQGLGFTLRDIKQLIDLHEAKPAVSKVGRLSRPAVEEIVGLASERLAGVEEKLRTLSAIRAELMETIRSLSDPSGAVCPVAQKKSTSGP